MTLIKYIMPFIMVLSLVACKGDEEPECETVPDSLRVTVQPVFGGQTLYLDSTYTTVEGYDVQFTEIKFYAENISNGSTQLHEAGLFDYRLRGTLLAEGSSDIANFTSISANLGVRSVLNHNDPSAFDNSSMLNIINANDMHWGWSPGYIFVKIDAKVDTIPDGIALFDHNVNFHIGKDENIQSLVFNNINWVDQGDVHVFPLKLDMQTVLQNGTETIDLKTEFTSHTAPGQEVLSLKVISNFKAALTPF